MPFFSGFTGQIKTLHHPHFPSELLFQVAGPVMSGSLPNHIRAWSKLQEQEGEQESLISHSVGIKLLATSRAHQRPAASDRAVHGCSPGVGAGGASEWAAKLKRDNRGQIGQIKQSAGVNGRCSKLWFCAAMLCWMRLLAFSWALFYHLRLWIKQNKTNYRAGLGSC